MCIDGVKVYWLTNWAMRFWYCSLCPARSASITAQRECSSGWWPLRSLISTGTAPWCTRSSQTFAFSDIWHSTAAAMHCTTSLSEQRRPTSTGTPPAVQWLLLGRNIMQSANITQSSCSVVLKWFDLRTHFFFKWRFNTGQSFCRFYEGTF